MGNYDEILQEFNRARINEEAVSIEKTLERNFRAFGLEKLSHGHFAARGPNTVTNYA
ncbi:hypothetical protein [Desulfosporosinus metallidurans]|uniref:Uncharacterized protein n=1 Tax=Desulfosporosinus metallidurans TaxID=1888891 RepID=A0A1Q8QZT8_9FIRM|nr:hypothetical protein DSOL_1328 [Desulfosporosinus metallidurans]